LIEAHTRIRPQDIPHKEYGKHIKYIKHIKRIMRRFKKKMFDVEKASAERRLAVYSANCKKFQPVFHHFFHENFPDPSQWFDRRLAYTRSVAANSITGYIVGLGDRHLQNILVCFVMFFNVFRCYMMCC